MDPMAYKQMKFKDRLVFVETDEQGELVIDGGRASMKYRPDDDRVYHPWPGNLTEVDQESDDSGKAPSRRVRAAPATKKAEGTGRNGEAIVAYTDGACIGNPGPSALGYLVIWPDGRQAQKGEPLGHGTNNTAELTAILRVLEMLDGATAPVTIHTDSAYAIGVLTRGWKAKANQALIRTIKLALSRVEKVELRKVAGHAGVAENELVDDLARTAARAQREVDQV